MRHRKSFNHLGRKVGHRNSMLANMAASLILHKRIKTTTTKAKALKVFVEPLITKSKDDSTQSRRVVFSYLQDKNAVTELFREVSPKIADRPGGYTRILKTGTRLGDNAEMCIIELVDYNENLLKAKEDTGKSGRRRRRGGKKKTEEATPEVSAVETAQESVETETSVDEKAETPAQEETLESEAKDKVEKKKAETDDQQVDETIKDKIEKISEEVKEEEEVTDSESENSDVGEKTSETEQDDVNNEAKDETKKTDDSEEKKEE